MSQKSEKPTLSGQRIKNRKRDEKEKYDPAGFRDAILQGLGDAGSDLEAGFKFLDSAGSKLDYRRYGEALFDILLAGGILAPGGSLTTDADPNKIDRTDMCVFMAPDNLDTLRNHAHRITKLIRRYKYLEKTLEDEFKKVLIFLKGFTGEERKKLAKVTALLVAGGQVPASVLTHVLQDHLVKDGLALEYIIEVFKTWLGEKDHPTLWATLRKAGLDTRLLDFFPVSKRSQEHFSSTFTANSLGHLVDYQKAQEHIIFKKELSEQLHDLLMESAPPKDVISLVREHLSRHTLPETDLVSLLWNTLMGVVEWNKKEELVADQALKHVRMYSPLLQAFTQSGKAELALIIKVQDYCYDNMNFMKVFSKFIYLFYKSEVLSEDIILKWYDESHSSKGKSIFLEQTKKFIEWLKNAEEESEGED